MQPLHTPGVCASRTPRPAAVFFLGSMHEIDDRQLRTPQHLVGQHLAMCSSPAILDALAIGRSSAHAIAAAAQDVASERHANGTRALLDELQHCRAALAAEQESRCSVEAELANTKHQVTVATARAAEAMARCVALEVAQNAAQQTSDLTVRQADARAEELERQVLALRQKISEVALHDTATKAAQEWAEVGKEMAEHEALVRARIDDYTLIGLETQLSDAQVQLSDAQVQLADAHAQLATTRRRRPRRARGERRRRPHVSPSPSISRRP